MYLEWCAWCLGAFAICGVWIGPIYPVLRADPARDAAGLITMDREVMWYADGTSRRQCGSSGLDVTMRYHSVLARGTRAIPKDEQTPVHNNVRCFHGWATPCLTAGSTVGTTCEGPMASPFGLIDVQQPNSYSSHLGSQTSHKYSQH